uniref:Ubiquitin hydrolase n=1 Tax=Tanacetum cinerariifolium TaxID=118510 RepID=A0A6L2L9P9_TANCI|nr:ubiquitin hydrolase [Tanacetum cinerariifolium]
MPKVLLLAWDSVFKIKDAFGNKQYKPEHVQELFRELFNDVQNIYGELAEYINTSGWNRHAFYNNGDDDDEDCTIAVTPDFLITDSLIMGDEHLDTIPEKESDEFNKCSVKDLVPNPNEFEDECGCDVPDCDDSQTTNFSTFSNPFFDDSTSSADKSSHDEDIHEMSFKTYSNPLFDLDKEIISTNCDPEEDIHLVDRLLYDNSSPRPPKEFVYENSNANIESFFPSPIPNEDSDSFMEEIDLFLTLDDPMPPSIKDDDDDSERDILILKELIDNYSLSLTEMSHFVLIFPRFLVLLQNHQMEKSPDLLSHRSLEIFQLSTKCPMMIHGKNIPILDVESSADCIESLKKELEVIKNEKEGLESKLTVYSPPKKDMSWTGLSEFADDTITNYSRPSTTIESNTNDTNKNSYVTESRESSNIITSKPAIKFVKAVDRPAERPTTDKVETTKKPSLIYAELYRKTTKSSKIRGNQRNWNNLKSHQLGANFMMKKKACYNCGGIDHLSYDCGKWVKMERSCPKNNNTHKSM